jgi:Iap family predicted aminopeptidase
MTGGADTGSWLTLLSGCRKYFILVEMDEYVRFHRYCTEYRRNMKCSLTEYIHYHSLLRMLYDLHREREEEILKAIEKCKRILES